MGASGGEPPILPQQPDPPVNGNHVVAAGYGGGDWDGTERRQRQHWHGNGGNGNGGGIRKQDLAVGAGVGALAAVLALLVAWFTVAEYTQRPIKSELQAVSNRLDDIQVRM